MLDFIYVDLFIYLWFFDSVMFMRFLFSLCLGQINNVKTGL